MENIWGDYAILDGVTHNLERKPEFFFNIRPITAADELAMQKIFQKIEHFDADLNRIIPVSNLDAQIVEVAMAYAGSNIPHVKESVKDGKLVQEKFDPPAVGSPFEVVREYIESMNRVVVEELWLAVGKANPTLGPKLQNELANRIFSAVKLLRLSTEVSQDEKVLEALGLLNAILGL